METKSTFNPVVRHITTNDFYLYEGNNVFKNIRTGVSGNVSEDAAKKNFRINLEMSELVNEYPNIKDLINRLDLKFKETHEISGLPRQDDK